MMDIGKRFYWNAVSICATRDISLARMCEKSGASYSGMVRIKNGETLPSIQTVQKVAEFFGVPMGDLLDKEYVHVAPCPICGSTNYGIGENNETVLCMDCGMAVSGANAVVNWNLLAGNRGRRGKKK